jgi:hypothetical protein
VSEATFVEIRKHARIGVTRSLDASITIIGVEMVVTPNIDVVRRGILIGFVAKLGSGSSGISVVRNLNRSLALPKTTMELLTYFKWCLLIR